MAAPARDRRAHAAALSFGATIRKIDINPYVRVPAAVVRALRERTVKSAGPIPVKGALQGKRFTAHVVRFRGLWRLYLNTPMRRAAGSDVGDAVEVMLQADAAPRVEPMPPLLARQLAKAPRAKAAFGRLAPYRRKEILRYLNNLKRAETLERNVAKVLQMLSD
jgi:hypothetical protein